MKKNTFIFLVLLNSILGKGFDAKRKYDSNLSNEKEKKPVVNQQNLRKLEVNNEIIITIEGDKGDSIPFIGNNFLSKYPPKEIYVNNIINEKLKNTNEITFDKTGQQTIKILWDIEFTDLSNMFANCYFVISIDFSNFDTSKVENMEYMFGGCMHLISLDLSNFDTSKVENMEFMFGDCGDLISLDLSNFDTSQVTNMKEMFCYDYSLVSIKLTNWDVSNVERMTSMFSYCSSLKSLDLKSFKDSKVYEMNYMFTHCSSLKSIDLSNIKTTSLTNIDNLFSGCSSLKTVNLSNFDTSNIYNMGHLFHGCSSLESIDLSNFKTSTVTNMESMFNGCSSLTSLKITNFETSNVFSMIEMFKDCSSLTSLDLSNFDVSRISNMDYMFNGCSSLTSLDLSSFKTTSVMVMQYTFNNCSSLKSLDISNFDTSKLDLYESVFSNCDKIEYINLLNYKGKDIFDSFPKYNFKICINDYSKIETKNSEENSLKKNKIENKCIETEITELTEKTEISSDSIITTDEISTSIVETSPISVKPSENATESLPDVTIYLLGFDKFNHDTKIKKGTFNYYVLNIEPELISKTLNLYLKVNYNKKRRLQNEDGETIKANCQFADSKINNLIKYECEFTTTGDEIIKVKILDKYEFGSQNVKFSGKSFIALKYMDNLQDSKEEIFNKKLYLLEDSKIEKKNGKFNITGKLTENNFKYKNVNLQFNFKNNGNIGPEFKTASCTAIHSNDEYILECTSENELKGEIGDPYSNLGDANLFIIFKNEDNILSFSQIIKVIFVSIVSIVAMSLFLLFLLF